MRHPGDEPPVSRTAESGHAAGESRADLDRLLAGELSPASWLLAAYMFGSRARGRARPDSDLDLAVLVDASSPLVPRSPIERAEWILEWASGLSARLGIAVDAVDLERAGVVLIHQVMSTGRKLLERDRVRTRAYEAGALQAYYDFLPVERTLARAAMASIRRRARW